MNHAAEAPASRRQHGAAEDTASAASQYLSFSLDDRTYAIPLTQVAEITPFRELNRMPHMPKGVEGLLDLRGAVIPVIDLRTRMGLPPKDIHECRNILILDVGSSRLGALVDRVDSVLNATPDQHAPVSPLLEGQEGVWIQGFLLFGERVIVILDSLVLTHSTHHGHGVREHLTHAFEDLELRLDEDLRRLIELAPPREDEKVVPQIETAITHTESEMSRVLDRIEAMLEHSDQALTGLTRLKQEAALGRIKGQDSLLAEVEKLSLEIQDSVFNTIQQVQFQDIVRQKLERVLTHIRGMQGVISERFQHQPQPRH